MTTYTIADVLEGRLVFKTGGYARGELTLNQDAAAVAADDDVSITLNYTTAGGTSSEVIFAALIEEEEKADLTKIFATSKAKEIDNKMPSGLYRGYSETILGDIITDNCDHVTATQTTDVVYLRPDSDVDQGSWDDPNGDNDADLYDDVDESGAADGSYIESANLNDVCEFSLSDHGLSADYHYMITRLDFYVTARCDAGTDQTQCYWYNGSAWSSVETLNLTTTWQEFTWAETSLTYTEAEANTFKFRVKHGVGGTSHWIDKIYVKATYKYYANMGKGTQAVQSVTFAGDRPVKAIADWLAGYEGMVWYLDKSLELRLNDGSTATGETVAKTDNPYAVTGKKQIRSIDKVILYGGMIGNVQLTSTQGVGNTVFKDTYTHVIDQTQLDNLATSILTLKGANNLAIQFTWRKTSVGLMQPGETFAIGASDIYYGESSSYIPANNYIITKAVVTIADGQEATITYFAEDGIIWNKKPVEEEVEDNSQLAIQSAGSGVTLAGMSDVTITSVADNEILAYDSATTHWINQTATEAGGLTTNALAHAYVEANALTLTEDLTMSGNNIVMAGAETVDGKDVSTLCTTAEAHAYVEANALTLTEDLTMSGNNIVMAGAETVDGKDVSTLCTTAEAHAYVEANALTMENNIAMGANDITGLNDMTMTGDIVAGGGITVGGDVILSDDSAVEIDPQPADGKSQGIVITIDTTGCAVYDLVYCDGDQSVLPADATDDTKMPVIGMCVGVNKVLIQGTVAEADWGWTAGNVLYADDAVAGAIVETIAGLGAAGNIVQVVGVAIGDDEVYINPSLDWVEVV